MSFFWREIISWIWIDLRSSWGCDLTATCQEKSELCSLPEAGIPDRPRGAPQSPPPTLPLFLYFLLAFCHTGKTTGSTGLPPRAFNWRDVLTTLITVAGKERNTPTVQKAWPSPSLSVPRLMWLHFPSEPHRLHQGCTTEATPVFKPILSPWKCGLAVHLPYLCPPFWYCFLGALRQRQSSNWLLLMPLLQRFWNFFSQFQKRVWYCRLNLLSMNHCRTDSTGISIAMHVLIWKIVCCVALYKPTSTK